MSFRVAILTSHVIQYQDPLFKRLAANPELDLTVYFCSRDGLTQYHDKDLGVTLKWDLDFLSGYRHVFLRNFSPFRAGMLRLFNPGIVGALRRGKYDAVVTQGWGSPTTWLAFFTCWATRTPLLLNGDSSFVFPSRGLKGRMRDALYRVLFKRTAGFLVMGAMNGDFYAHFGADRRRFYHFPYAIDNDRFARGSALTADERRREREQRGIDPDAYVVLFSGKLMPLKNPDHILEAVARMRHRSRTAVVFMGSGELSQALARQATSLELAAVYFLGFVNQTEMPRVYAMSDMLVLPSSRDHRGTVVNEAMACGLPIVITDKVGIYGPGDILRVGENGFTYPVGDVDALAAHLDRLAEDEALRRAMARRSREIIANWSFEDDVSGLLRAVGEVTKERLGAQPDTVDERTRAGAST